MKRCTACPRVYSRLEWEHLPLVGRQFVPPCEPTEGDDGRAMDLVMRNCECGTTLAIDLFDPPWSKGESHVAAN